VRFRRSCSPTGSPIVSPASLSSANAGMSPAPARSTRRLIDIRCVTIGAQGANPMSNIFAILLQVVGMMISPASAQAPSAVVEEVGAGVAGVQFMDYVEPGQIIRLGAADRLVLGYLKSCWRETITGGTVTVGTEQSQVAGGEVARAQVQSEGGKMMLSAQLAGKSGAMVFRQAPKQGPKAQAAAIPHPQFTLYGLSPVFEVQPGGNLVIERLDQPGERHRIAVAEPRLIRGAFLDLAKVGVALVPGGIYRAKLEEQELVFKIDAQAKAGDVPLVGRLARLQARN